MLKSTGRSLVKTQTKGQMKKWLVAMAVLVFAVVNVLAQTNAPSAGASPAAASTVSAWVALIPLAVPVVIMLLKTFVPNIPSVALPILAPLLGAGADIALHYAGLSTLGPTWGAMLGSAGVGLREIGDQIRQQMAAQSPPTT
jgi:hypothetical protein